MAQGSCLGSLLFILFCNDIYLLPIYGTLILFADDTTLFNHHQNRKFLSFMMTHDMSILDDWFRANQLSLNLSKTVSMLFWPNGKELKINMDGYIILQVTHTQFLGVLLDKELLWTAHINHIKDKLKVNKHMLQLGKNFLNHLSIKNVYYAHIHSHLTYSLLTWGCMINKWQLNDLMKIQRACVRIICKKPSTYNSKVLFEQEHIPTLQNLIDLEAAKFGYKISCNLVPKPIQNIMNAKGGKKTHTYHTCNKTTPNIQRHQSTQFNRSFLCRSISSYTNLPEDLKQTKSYKNFCTRAKRLAMGNIAN